MNRIKKYDLIIVGAGPAGSVAAMDAAGAGLSVLLLEKRQEIGSPVRCAEGLGKKTLTQFVEPDPRWISRIIDGARLIAPDGGYVDIVSPGDGFILERKIFDRYLAERAATAGAEVRVKTMVTGLAIRDGAVEGIKIRNSHSSEIIEGKIVIAADGVESQVGRWAGLDTGSTLSGLDVCAQYHLAGVNLDKQEYCHFYFGKELAPGGYAWAFPKNGNSANVGLGIRPNSGRLPEQTAQYFLDKFVSEMFPGAVPVSFMMGSVPIDGKKLQLCGDGIMVVGDAAHQADPMTGGGITNAMTAGRLAAETAVSALEKGDVSLAGLRSYEAKWQKRLGRRFRHLVRIRDEIMDFEDETFNILAEKAGERRKATLFDIFKVALMNKPSLLWDMGQLILHGWFGKIENNDIRSQLAKSPDGTVSSGITGNI